MKYRIISQNKVNGVIIRSPFVFPREEAAHRCHRLNLEYPKCVFYMIKAKDYEPKDCWDEDWTLQAVLSKLGLAYC